MSLHAGTRLDWAERLDRMAAELVRWRVLAQIAEDETTALLLAEQEGGLRCAAKDLRDLSLKKDLAK